MLLRAVGEKPDTGILDAERRARIRRRHHAELREIGRLALRIGAAVAKKGLRAAHVGDPGAERGAKNALDAADEHDPARQDGARRTRRDKPARGEIVFQNIEPDDERTVALGAHGRRGNVVVGDDLCAVDDLHAGSVVGVFIELVFDERFVSRKNDLEITAVGERLDGALDDLGGSVVPAHGVHDNFEHIFPSEKKKTLFGYYNIFPRK